MRSTLLALALLPLVPSALGAVRPGAPSHPIDIGLVDSTTADHSALVDAGAAHHQRSRSHTLLARRQRAHAVANRRETTIDKAGKTLVRRMKKRATCQAPVAAGSATATPSSTVDAETLQAKPSSTTPASSTIATEAASSTGAPASASPSSAAASASAESASASSTASAASTAATGSLATIFPQQGSSWWTTSTLSSSALSFSDAMTPLTSGKFPATSTAPDGTLGLIANYPGGTYGYSSANGQGFSFYSPASANGVDVSTATEVLFTYSVFFPTGFDFVKGGKLPGIYGGTSLEAAKTCSGGRQDDRADCWSARTMFRTNGMGEFYNYFPTSAVQPAGYCSTAPMSVCNPQYGDSIGRGVFTFATGAWTTVGQRLKMNDVGVSNGEQELYINGQSVLKLDSLQIAVKDGTHIYGIMAQTFFGGGDSSWANPETQSAWFKDWSMTVLA